MSIYVQAPNMYRVLQEFKDELEQTMREQNVDGNNPERQHGLVAAYSILTSKLLTRKVDLTYKL